jgi:choline dehydrogenase-like flavoprotein
MRDPAVCIVGSGIVGTAIAYVLTTHGYEVDVFEKGPEYPYPHTPQFRERVLYGYENPAYAVPGDLQGLELSGSYRRDLDHERHMIVGGAATHWGAITLRMRPQDFATRTLYGFGEDWPVTYRELEPYYGRAEALLGVSGTDDDNPFAPPRSQPYPLPPFPLSYEDRILAERLGSRGIVLHTTPQAATRLDFGDRPACQNFGACDVCPIGARYSPNEHLRLALGTGRCRLYVRTSVRRLVADPRGRVVALLTRPGNGDREEEHPARLVVLAGGAIETARLLLLSSRDRHPDGIPLSDHVGRHLTFHHLWTGRLTYREPMYPGRIGRFTGQSHQFLDPPGRGRHGGIKVEFSANIVPPPPHPPEEAASGADVLALLGPTRYQRMLTLHAETAPSPGRFVTLGSTRDRFGDPYAHVHYELTDFDEETYRFGRTLFERIARATGAEDAVLEPVESFYSGGHHMGTCRMGRDRRDSVADSLGAVHGCQNLFVAGGALFVGPAGVNPTLTMVALAIRTADALMAGYLRSPR